MKEMTEKDFESFSKALLECDILVTSYYVLGLWARKRCKFLFSF